MYSGSAVEIPPEIHFLLTNVAKSPEDEIKRNQDLKEYIAKESSHIGTILAQLGAGNPLSGNLARSVAHCGEPRDYLIIVTQFLNEVADGNFDVVKGDSVVSDLLFPEDELEGLIAMNYELPELNEALHRVEPKLIKNSNLHKFFKDILSGKQKNQTIIFFEGQGFPLPATFSSLYPKGQSDNSSSRALKNRSETGSHESILESSRNISKWERFKAGPLWWICAVGGLLLVGVVIRLASRKT